MVIMWVTGSLSLFSHIANSFLAPNLSQPCGPPLFHLLPCFQWLMSFFSLNFTVHFSIIHFKCYYIHTVLVLLSGGRDYKIPLISHLEASHFSSFNVSSFCFYINWYKFKIFSVWVIKYWWLVLFTTCLKLIWSKPLANFQILFIGIITWVT